MKWTGLAVLAAFISIQFFSLWWLNVIAVVGCTVLAGMLELENDRLRAELDRYKMAQEQGREPPSSPEPKAADAFLRRLRQLGPLKPSSERKQD